MFSIVELKTALLDSGIPGISPLHMMLLFLLLAGVPMIPYLFLHRSLRHEEGEAKVPKDFAFPGIYSQMAALAPSSSTAPP